MSAVPRLLLTVLLAAVVLAGCGGDDKPKRLNQVEYTTFTEFFTAPVESPQDGRAACLKVKAAKDSAAVDALSRFCTGGLRVLIGTRAATLAAQRFCKARPDPQCTTAIKELRKQYGAIRGLLLTYNAQIEDALAVGDCREELRDTDAGRMDAFLDNMDAAIRGLEMGDPSPLERLGPVPEQDPNSDLKACRPT